jgi:hypothetical protein
LLYNDILELGLYNTPDSGVFPTELFRNILMLSLRMSKLNWAEQFIDLYSGMLPDKSRSNLYNYSKALLCFERSQFKESFLKIQNIHPNSLSMKLDTKNLLLRIYFELGQYDQFSSLAASYREFLSSTSNMPVSKKQKHREFIKLVEYLFDLVHAKNHSRLEILTYNIENSSTILFRNWFLKKLEPFISIKTRRQTCY